MEKSFNYWYFDTQNKIFKKCNDMCKTCNGPNNNNCLTCKDENLYAHNGNCFEECPNKTFKTFDDELNKICKECYENCAKCNGKGNSEFMNCLECSYNHIKYGQNCFQISNFRSISIC